MSRQKKTKNIKIAINCCHGGYSLSPEGILECYKRGMKNIAIPVHDYFFSGNPSEKEIKKQIKKALADWKKYKPGDCSYLTVFSPDEKFVLDLRPEDRTDPILISVLEEMGDAASGWLAELKIVKWPSELPWKLHDYDGFESVEIDTSELENWMNLSLINEGMRDLLNRCRVFYQIATKENK
jgi:hypothetical protein